jgi:hemolysin III
MVAITKKRHIDGEDLANSLSHLTGAALSVVALVLMIVISATRGNAWHIVSSAVFGFSMIFLYSSSAIAHWLPEGKAKNVFFILDQVAIFVLIAGTYTPLSLVALNGPIGWVVFIIEWGLAAVGIIKMLAKKDKFEAGVSIFDILLYVGMGWLILIVSVPVLKSISTMGFVWIITGGLFYTIGVIFYRITRFRYHHLVWHLFVIGGTVSHFVAIFFYVLP